MPVKKQSKKISSSRSKKIKKSLHIHEQAYIVAVDMGYGHQRAAYPLKDIAACPETCSVESNNIINANNYHGIPHGDKSAWNQSRGVYELISRMKNIPLIGQPIFDMMDYFQRIESFYPRRDLSKPSLQLKQIYAMIHKGWGRHLIQMLNKNPLPFITSFFIPAFFADVHGYKGEIYAICTDTDISRAWAPLDPKRSRINYLAPNKRVCERLQSYGVPRERIFMTGFPLPQENIGEKDSVLKKSLGERIVHLDPEKKYRSTYAKTIEGYLGKQYCKNTKHPLTITFAVGGAGAQREIGVEIMNSLSTYIKKGRVHLNLVAGSRPEIFSYFKEAVQKARVGKGVSIIYNPHKLDYFGEFNKALLGTDILWTKPSELSFYVGLGIPIIMTPGIGSQEQYNRAWLGSIGAALDQEDPRYTHEWLFDWLSSGWLAEAAMKGFLDAPRDGVQKIQDIVFHKKRSEIKNMELF